MDDICLSLISALNGLGRFWRRFFPPALSELRPELLPLMDVLKRARKKAEGQTVSEELSEALTTIIDAIDLTLLTLKIILDVRESDHEETIFQVMRSRRKICQVQEKLYGIRSVSSALDRFFLEPAVYEQAEKFGSSTDSNVLLGLNHFGADEAYARGKVSIYVPEYYTDGVSWPVVIALHGGNGHGRDFVWTWLREARSRGFILLAPTSKGPTWSILEPEIDGSALVSMLDFLKKHYRLNMDRVLLTGISDGGTFSLVLSAADGAPFTAYAPVAGVLAPMNLNFTKDKRIYWVHGLLDWMFPVRIAEQGFKALKAAGADVTLRILEDLSHTYPREENDRILKWFDPNLALTNTGS